MSADLYYSGRGDRSPGETRRKVLDVLAASAVVLRRRHIQQQVWDSDLFGAEQTIGALRWLLEHGFVEQARTDRRAYRITAAGRAALDLSVVFDVSA